MLRMAGVYWLGPSSKVRYTVPPRFAGGLSPCRDRCLGEAWAGGELSGRIRCGVRGACADGCFCEGLAVGLFRVGAFALGGLTDGVS
jgi:hypothetical protein